MNHLHPVSLNSVRQFRLEHAHSRVLAPVLAGLVAFAVVLGPTVLTPVLDMAGTPGVAYAQSAVGNYSPTPNPGCTPNSVPVGQSNPPASPNDPMAPAWCFNLNTAKGPDVSVGTNSWDDDFGGVAPYGQFNDGNYSYHVYNNINIGGTNRTQHWTKLGGWFDDTAGGFLGGAMLSPNRSFRFEQGKLVVEMDAAAGIPGYLDSGGGDVSFEEIDVSTGSAPNPATNDDYLYGYGEFHGNWTIGCRLHAGRNPICAVEQPTPITVSAGGQPPCFSEAPDRLMELSWFEQCGSIHQGGLSSTTGNDPYWRTCSASQPAEQFCRDRFRMEITQSSVTLYVNGHLYFEDANWPADHQIDPNVIANSPWYVYATDWSDRPSAPAYRFTWGSYYVMPRNPDGSIEGPTTSPSFCLGQPNNTCALGAPTATPIPSATNTPVPRTATPTNTPTQTPTTTPATSGGKKHNRATATTPPAHASSQ